MGEGADPCSQAVTGRSVGPPFPRACCFSNLLTRATDTASPRPRGSGSIVLVSDSDTDTQSGHPPSRVTQLPGAEPGPCAGPSDSRPPCSACAGFLSAITSVFTQGQAGSHTFPLSPRSHCHRPSEGLHGVAPLLRAALTWCRPRAGRAVLPEAPSRRRAAAVGARPLHFDVNSHTCTETCPSDPPAAGALAL